MNIKKIIKIAFYIIFAIILTYILLPIVGYGIFKILIHFKIDIPAFIYSLIYIYFIYGIYSYKHWSKDGKKFFILFYPWVFHPAL